MSSKNVWYGSLSIYEKIKDDGVKYMDYWSKPVEEDFKRYVKQGSKGGMYFDTTFQSIEILYSKGQRYSATIDEAINFIKNLIAKVQPFKVEGTFFLTEKMEKKEEILSVLIVVNGYVTRIDRKQIDEEDNEGKNFFLTSEIDEGIMDIYQGFYHGNAPTYKDLLEHWAEITWKLRGRSYHSWDYYTIKYLRNNNLTKPDTSTIDYILKTYTNFDGDSSASITLDF